MVISPSGMFFSQLMACLVPSQLLKKERKESEVAQSCLTLCNPMDCSLPGFSVYGIFQARVLEWVAISFFRGSSWPRDWTQVSCIAGRHFTLWATREALSTLWATREALSTFSIILNVSPLGGLSWPLQSLSTEPDSFKETIDSDCICLCAFHGQLESLRLCQDDIWHRLPSIPGACVCGHISFLTFWLLDYKFLLAHAWKAGQTSGQALDDLAHGKSHELRFRSPSPCAQNLCSGDSPRGAPAF